MVDRAAMVHIDALTTTGGSPRLVTSNLTAPADMVMAARCLFRETGPRDGQLGRAAEWARNSALLYDTRITTLLSKSHHGHPAMGSSQKISWRHSSWLDQSSSGRLGAAPSRGGLQRTEPTQRPGQGPGLEPPSPKSRDKTQEQGRASIVATSRS
jgi:hypothetical protein